MKQRISIASVLLSALLVTPLASCGGGGGSGGGGVTASSSAPTATPELSNSFVNGSGQTVGDSTGFATVQFTLTQEAGETSDVRVEFSADGGASWSPATIVDDLLNLGASAPSGLVAPAKSVHQVRWNVAADLGAGDYSAANALAGFPPIKTRVRVLGSGVSAPSAQDLEINLMGLAIPGGLPLSLPRARHGTSVLPDGNLLVVGGESTGGVTDSSELGFRPDGVGDFSFASNGMLGGARSGATVSVLADTRIVVAGGDASGGPSSLVDVYDPVSGSFTAATSMNVARSGHVAALLADGRVLVAGGTSLGASGTGEVYDPVADAWNLFALTGAFSEGTIARLPDGALLVAGAAAGSSSPASERLVLQANGSIATSVGTPPLAVRFGATATPLPDGRVLYFGGRDDADQPSAPAAEIYDPENDQFTAVDPLNADAGFTMTGRWAHTATALGDGTVLITGGRTSTAGGLLAQTEFFLPIADTFTPASPLPEARADHQVDVLAGGFAVVTGGVTDDGSGGEAPTGVAATLVPPSGMNLPPSVQALDLTYFSAFLNAELDYEIVDLEGDPASVRIDWTLTPNDASSWRPATRDLDLGVPQGDPLAGLTSSPIGAAHTFTWDVIADGVFAGGPGLTPVSVRVTPFSGEVAGTPFVFTTSLLGP